MTSRKLVLKTLEFDNPERAPRDMWVLPWAEHHYPEELEEIKRAYPSDSHVGVSASCYRTSF